MREFTKEEKELIINTEITMNCFDTDGVAYQWWTIIDLLEEAREVVLENKNNKLFEVFFMRFVQMLPNSYKVVKL